MSRPRGFRLELLGGFRAVVNGTQRARPLTARQQQLVAFLALHAEAPVPRQLIAGSLWPDSTDAQALTNLRREWHHLRDSWPELDRAIDAGTRTFTWRPEAKPEFDIHDFDRAAVRGLQGDRAALEEAARQYRGDLLPECGGEWIGPDRERLRQQAIAVLSQLIDALEREHATTDLIARAKQLADIDPLHEPAWCALMRGHARRGERATALHLYQRFASLLKEELDVEPGPAAQMTYRDVLEFDDEAATASLDPPRTAVYPLIGRQSEWSTLVHAWHRAGNGRPELLLIRGEAGIGKTRLAEELATWCEARAVAVSTTRCYAGDGRLAYAPIAAWLQSSALQSTLLSIDAVWVSEIARIRPDVILSRSDVARPSPQLEPWQRGRLFDALSRVFESTRPLLLVLDDLQWCDADTLEWLHYFLRSARDARCLIVATVRAEEEPDNPALGVLLPELQRMDRLTVVALGPLDEPSTARLAEEVAEHPLADDAKARTFQQTEGHPLFIVERGRMEGTGGSTGDALSPRVQAIVAARLERLSDDARSVAQAAAAIGRDFAFDMLAEVCDLEEDAVVRALDELWRRHIVRVQADERWDFSHDRIREVAYGSIGPARTRLVHRRIAQALERSNAGNLDPVSAQIASHVERGGQPLRAIPFLERAAEVAVRVSANEEAIRCLTHALAILGRTPPGRDRDERELAIREALSPSLTPSRGYAAPEVEQNLERVIALARPGRGDLPVRWLWSRWTVHFMLGDLQSARRVSEEALARSRHDPSCLCEAHHAMAGTLTSVGDLEGARAHFEAALAAYDERSPQTSAFGSDLGVFAHAWYAHALWLAGDADSAVAHADEALALARRLDHLYSQALALAYAALTHQLRRDLVRTEQYANAAVELCDRYGFGYYIDWARVLLGWVRGQRGEPQEGVTMIEGAIERLDAQRAQARRPYYLSLLAETYAAASRPDRAASIVNAAIEMALARNDVWWLAELYRQKGELAAVS